MSLPLITRQRWVLCRPLTTDECDRLELESPLTLARREDRFVLGPWRAVDEYAVTHRRHGRLLVASGDELAALGLEV